MNAYQFALGIAKSLDAKFATSCCRIANRRRRSLDRIIDDQTAIRALGHLMIEYVHTESWAGFIQGIDTLSVKRIADTLFNLVLAKGLPICTDKQSRLVAANKAINEVFTWYLAVLCKNSSQQSINQVTYATQMNADKLTQSALCDWGALMLEPNNLNAATNSLKGLRRSERKKRLLCAMHRLTSVSTAPNSEEVSAILQMTCHPLSVH